MGLFDGTPLERPVTCERCGKPLEADAGADSCACSRDNEGTLRRPEDIHPRVRREKRRGKWCTVVGELGEPADGELKALLKTLRTSLGTGGGIDGETASLVIQGDHRDAIVERLKAMGYRAKASGG